MKRLAVSVGFVSLCAWLAIYADPPAPERTSALHLECLGHQFPNDCRVRLKDAK
jgi:hypothetical protein